MLAALVSFAFQQLDDKAILRKAVAQLQAEQQKIGGVSKETWEAVAWSCSQVAQKARTKPQLDKVIESAFPNSGTEPILSIYPGATVHGRQRAILWTVGSGTDSSVWLVDWSGPKTSIAVLRASLQNEDPTYYADVDAYATSDKLWIVGVLRGTVNTPPNGMQIFEKRESEGWVLEQEFRSEGETSQRPRITYKSDRPDLKDFQCVSRFYPKSISVCHACPHLLMKEAWTLQGGRYLVHQDWVQTPLFTLDQIFLALQGRKTALIDSWIQTPSLRTKVETYFRLGGPGSLTPYFGNANVVSGDAATQFVMTNGPSRDYLCTFQKSKGIWKLSGFDPGHWDRQKEKFTKSGQR